MIFREKKTRHNSDCFNMKW